MSVRRTVSIYIFSAALSIILFQSVFLSIFTPCPQIFCYLRLGRLAGLSLPLILFSVFSFVGQNIGLGYLLQFGILGILISEAIRRRYSIEKSFTISTSVAVASALLILGYHARAENISTAETVKLFSEKIIEQSIDINEKAGMSAAQIDALKALSPEISNVLARLYPSLMVAAVMVTLWLNIMVLSRVMRRAGGEVPFKNLSEWKAPEQLVWAVVFGGASFFTGWAALKVTGVNLLVVLFVIYLFQGMAIVSFYFNKKKLSGPLKGIFYVIILWYLAVVIALVGLFDMWADFRKLSKPDSGKA